MSSSSSLKETAAASGKTSRGGRKRPSTAISTALHEHSTSAHEETNDGPGQETSSSLPQADKDGNKSKRQVTAGVQDEEEESTILPPPTTPTGTAPKVTWEPRIAQEIWKLAQQRQQQQQQEEEAKTTPSPFMVAVVGIPGSGKTTSAAILVDLLQKEQGKNASIVMPMDGYHYSIKVLKEMPQSEDKIYRRGAPDTFDAATLAQDLHRIRSGDEEVVSLPGFDHAVGDPEPNQHSFVRRQHEIVLCEGLYLLHNQHGWEGLAAKYFDFTIFVHADINLCIQRLKIRNQCIPGYTAEQINQRCDDVDRTNAHTVNQSRQFATVIVESSTATTTATKQQDNEKEEANAKEKDGTKAS